MKLKLIALVFSLLMIAAFALQNTEQVEVTFLLWGISLPRSLLLLAVFCLGMLGGISVSTLATHRHKRKSG